MSHALQRIDETREALLGALAERNWEAVGELDLGCRAVIDEVLSVGDEKFKKKSYEKMKSLISQRNRTVVIVSHSLKTLEELCDRVMWMHEGKIVKIGEPVEVLNEYREFMK